MKNNLFGWVILAVVAYFAWQEMNPQSGYPADPPPSPFGGPRLVAPVRIGSGFGPWEVNS